MRTFSNRYIFIFSAVMVIIVAVLLSVISIFLKPAQVRNIEIEKMKSILASVNIESTARDAVEKYNANIKESYVVNSKGEIKEGVEAFGVDLKNELTIIEKVKAEEIKLEEKMTSPFNEYVSSFVSPGKIDQPEIQKNIKELKQERNMPVYVYKKDTNTYYIFPLQGKGLWGPIWGYVSFERDLNTIYGATFDHKSETPGLGAEIKESWFEKAFIGKKIFNENRDFVSVEIVKGGVREGDENVQHKVDAISGGTITSKGLEMMLKDFLSGYEEFIKKHRK